MRQFAVRLNMYVKLAAENRGGAMLKYQRASGGDCRFEVTRRRSQGQTRSGYFTSHFNLVYNLTITVNSFLVREVELIRSLAASDPGISGRVLVEHINRIHGGTTLHIDLALYAETRSGIQLVMPYAVILN
ncbi:LOW QUALITY PROTEIN: Hypothetical protein PHPALM_20290 [Phytophthora palmivora]|uniref:Uncharacterized protein n=1 Tax=Phytophthora palmivora TaxID=4796 RepID=A0A2P4XF96_9STRA|nr:LOW QUALITY PROTEIN: Hypothetical protein PHPALM_20290 [Phytophthora palmivora]